MSKKVFVSHATADKPLVDALVDLLQTGANTDISDIFCSSIEGANIPPGVNFVEYIRAQLKAPSVVILVLSKNYLVSQFCLCELGASWMLVSEILPILVQPVTYEDVKGVLTGIQVSRIGMKDEMNSFIEKYQSLVANSGFSFPRWEVKRDQFFSRLSDVLSLVPLASVVSQKEHAKVYADYNSAMEALKKSMEENEEISAKLVAVTKLKDKAEVESVLSEFGVADDEYESLVNFCIVALQKLPTVVVYGAYQYFCGNGIVIRNKFEQRELADDARDAREKDFFSADDGIYSLNQDDPLVTKAIESLTALDRFLQECEPDFVERISSQLGFAPKIKNRRFWTGPLQQSVDHY